MNKPSTHSDDPVVSFDSESLILVDEQDQEVGYQDKQSCHNGQGTLHRAFSLFIFNAQGELLLQQRSATKRLWPLYWSNSCCSHPRRGETMEQAIHRRLEQEMGITSHLKYLYKFKYQVPYQDLGAEHELCWVYVGRSEDLVKPNTNEIADWRFIDAQPLTAELQKTPEQFTPWFKLEWECLTQSHQASLKALHVNLS